MKSKLTFLLSLIAFSTSIFAMEKTRVERLINQKNSKVERDLSDYSRVERKIIQKEALQNQNAVSQQSVTPVVVGVAPVSYKQLVGKEESKDLSGYSRVERKI